MEITKQKFRPLALRFARLLPLSAAVLFFLQPAGAQNTPQNDDEPSPVNAVVKIEVSTSSRSFSLPWIVLQNSGSGSGVVIAENRILTCAHCVSDALFIRVRKNNEDSIYHAETEFIDHDRDLALLKVDDPAFMNGIIPMQIGETPQEQSEVIAIGFPTGGQLISYTRGIVSRVEDIEYTHGKQEMLAVQVDAAISPGNSGGPVLDMETFRIAGIAFQGRDDGEALGYIIPAEIVNCFLKDTKDGRVDGIPESLFSIHKLESEAKRRYLGMTPGQSGCQIARVSPTLGTNSIQEGDILLEIDGYRVANNGSIRIDGNRIRTFSHPFYLRQIGEEVPVKVLRKGKTIETSVRTGKYKSFAQRFLYEKEPDWFVWGALVFTTFSYSYAEEVSFQMHDDVNEENLENPDDRFVMLSMVFSDLCVEGYLGMSDTHVRSVNGTKVRNLKHLVELLEGATSEFVTIGIDCGDEQDYCLVVDAAQIREATPRVMKHFQIPADRSKDLRVQAQKHPSGERSPAK